jgi:hypothetical protein
MKQLTLNKIVRKHELWLSNETGGKRANLRNANLCDVDLRYVDLRSANLRNANLQGTNLRYAIGNGVNIKSLQITPYDISYTDKMLQIGCKSYSIDKWWKFDDAAISVMDKSALEWWRIWKPILIQIIETSPGESTEVTEK